MIFQFNADDIQNTDSVLCSTVLRLSGSSIPRKLKGVAMKFYVYISPAPKFSDGTRGLVLFSGSKHSKEKKPASSLKTFYICMIVVGFLALAIALAMCLFQRAKR